MKRLGVFLLPSVLDARPSQGYPPALSLQVAIYSPGGERHCAVIVKWPAQEHNAMRPQASARALMYDLPKPEKKSLL